MVAEKLDTHVTSLMFWSDGDLTNYPLVVVITPFSIGNKTRPSQVKSLAQLVSVRLGVWIVCL